MATSSPKRLKPEQLRAVLKGLHGSSSDHQAPRSAAAHTYDKYREKWDNFDVEAALRSVEDAERSAAPTQRQTPPPTHAKTDATTHTRNEPLTSADAWRERGNEHYKAGRWQEAYDSYERSIQAQPTSAAFANRAMAALKLKRHRAAEADCTQALALHPMYVKAYLRRGTARKEMGNMSQAIEDFEAALRLEPANRTAVQERTACIAGWMASNGFPETQPRMKVHTVPVVMGNITAEDDLLHAVATTRNTESKSESGATTARVATVKALTPSELEDEDALPPLPGMAREGTSLGDGRLEPARPGGDERQLPPQESYSAKLVTPVGVAASNSTLDIRQEAHQPIESATPASHFAKAADTSAPSRSLSKYPTPRTGVEFERAWRGCKGDEALQSMYLLVVDPAKLPSLLKQVLTPALLAAMICTLLRQTMIENEHAALQLLSGLPRVPRFSMNVLSLSSAQRKEVASAWDKTMGSLEGHEIKAQLQEIRDASYSTL